MKIPLTCCAPVVSRMRRSGFAMLRDVAGIQAMISPSLKGQVYGDRLRKADVFRWQNIVWREGGSFGKEKIGNRSRCQIMSWLCRTFESRSALMDEFVKSQFTE